MQRATSYAVVTVLVLAALAAAETTRQEMHFKVGRRASVSIVNQYGAISVKPGPGKVVAITAILYSTKVEIDHSKSRRRVAVFSIFSKEQTPIADASIMKFSCLRMRA